MFTSRLIISFPKSLFSFNLTRCNNSESEATLAEVAGKAARVTKGD